MVISKIGHCCLLIELEGVRILTDPGAWSELPSDLGPVDAVLITHEHADHFHIPSLKKIIGRTPRVSVYTNQAVSNLLIKENIPSQICGQGQKARVGEIEVAGYGHEHASIFPTIPSVMNTGFLVGSRLFYPGDAFVVPDVPVEVLALPVAGPWMKISEAIDYVVRVKPRVAFTVHDGMLAFPGPFHSVPQAVLSGAGIDFRPLLAGQKLEFED